MIEVLVLVHFASKISKSHCYGILSVTACPHLSMNVHAIYFNAHMSAHTEGEFRTDVHLIHIQLSHHQRFFLILFAPSNGFMIFTLIKMLIVISCLQAINVNGKICEALWR